MWTSATRAACALIITFYALESSTAQCASTEQVKCTSAVFLDPLGLSKCVNGSKWDVCNGQENQTAPPAKQLAQCLYSTGATRIFLGLLLRGFRQSIKFFLDLASPGSSYMIQDILDVLSPQFELYGIEARQLHAKHGCHQHVNITVPENLGIKQCVKLVQAFCKVKGRHSHFANLGYLLPSIVCFFQNVPVVNVWEVLKETSCIVLTTVIRILEGSPASLLANFLKFVKMLLNCEQVMMIPNTAERSLLNK
ncbi:uncharacterized protein LOC144178015 [Haemaphysalis longicornis]